MSNEELVALIQAGERDKLLELWTQVDRFVLWRAGKWMALPSLKGKGGVELDDLYQSGYLALLEAVDSFDSSRGMSFIGWFDFRLRTAFSLAYGLRTTRHQKDPLQHAVSMTTPLSDDENKSLTVSDFIADDTAEEAFLAVEDRDRTQRLYAALERALEALPEAQRSVLRARYYRGQTLEAIAAERGVGSERVRQIEAKGLRMLRHPKNNREIRRHW